MTSRIYVVMAARRCLWLFVAAVTSAELLTPANYADRVEDKQALILFTGKTKSGKLVGAETLKVINRIAEWVHDEEHDFVAVGHIDCSSAEGTPICEYMGLMNMPSGTSGPIYWGDPWNLLPFPRSSPSYEDLEKFILSVLKPECTLDRDEYCEKDELAKLAEYDGWSVGKLDAKIRTLEKTRVDAEAAYDEGIAALKTQGEALEADFSARQAALAERLALLRGVRDKGAP